MSEQAASSDFDTLTRDQLAAIVMTRGEAIMKIAGAIGEFERMIAQDGLQQEIAVQFIAYCKDVGLRMAQAEEAISADMSGSRLQ